MVDKDKNRYDLDKKIISKNKNIQIIKKKINVLRDFFRFVF